MPLSDSIECYIKVCEIFIKQFKKFSSFGILRCFCHHFFSVTVYLLNSPYEAQIQHIYMAENQSQDF